MKKKLWIGCILILLCTMALGMTTFAAGSKTMKNKKWVSGKGGIYFDQDKDGVKDEFELYDKQYYKIQIPKQGYIMVDVKISSLPGKQEYINYWKSKKSYNWDGEDEEFVAESLDLEILNAKKKELAYYNGDEIGNKNIKRFSWAVKKGTYYLSARGNAAYKLRYTFTPVAKVSKAGGSFAKAATLKKGATVKNLLTPSDTAEYSGHYYKLKLSKKLKVTLACDSKIAGGIYDCMFVQMYVKKGKDYRQINTKGKLISKNSSYWYDMNEKDSISYNLPKGTYYLRVSSMLGSGYYTMKWK